MEENKNKKPIDSDIDKELNPDLESITPEFLSDEDIKAAVEADKEALQNTPVETIHELSPTAETNPVETIHELSPTTETNPTETIHELSPQSPNPPTPPPPPPQKSKKIG